MQQRTLQISEDFSAGRGFETIPGLTLEEAYSIEAELREGRKVVGRKVGFANKALWRVLKLETLVSAAMYEDTVVMGGSAWEAFGHSLRIEPEIVIKLKAPVPRHCDAGTVLDATEWIALGFEIIDCPYPGWKFAPADFVAAYGLHRKLFVGTQVTDFTDFADKLASFRIKLFRNGELVEEGAGKNSLKSPALCVAELGAEAGEIISTGTLTSGSFIKPGETWLAECDGLPVPSLSLEINA